MSDYETIDHGMNAPAAVCPELAREQMAVQASKTRDRLLADYGDYFLKQPNGLWKSKNPLKKFLEDTFENPVYGVDDVLRGLGAQAGKDTVRWVDMGAGFALPQWQAAQVLRNTLELDLLAVDVLPYDTAQLNQVRKFSVDNSVPGTTDRPPVPRRQEDIATVKLDEPADLITSIQALQYLDDPYAAVANWYNQTRDGGLLAIAVGGNIRQSTHWDGAEPDARPPFNALISELKRGGVTCSTTHYDWRLHFNRPIVQRHYQAVAINKKPGTQLTLAASPSSVTVDEHGYKTVGYTPHAESATPLRLVQAA